MTTPALHPDAIAAKHDLLNRWRDGEAGRKESLDHWTVSRLADGTLLVSARVCGPNPSEALHRFVDRQAVYLANRMEAGRCGVADCLPALDVSDPGRTAVVWRTGGVWVELWHPSNAAARQEPRRTAPEPPASAQDVPAPSPSTVPAARRSFLTRPGGRLPFTRRSKTPKETPAA